MSRKGIKKVRKMSTSSPEEILARAFRAKCRFKAAVRFVMQNIYWLEDVEDQELGDDVKMNIKLLTKKKDKKSLLTLQDKALLNKPAEFREEHEKLHLFRVIGGLKCFRRYPAEVKRQLAAVTYFVYYGPGRTIVRQGDEAHALYFLLSGDVAVTQEVFDPVLNEFITVNLGMMGQSGMFGEVSLLHDIKRTATVTSTTHCEMLCLKKHDFNVVLKGTVQQHWDGVQNSMKRFSYFDDWDEITIRDCCIIAKTKTYSSDQTILGDEYGLNEYVYFVLKGKCRVIEHFQVITKIRKGKKYYTLYTPENTKNEKLKVPSNSMLRTSKTDTAASDKNNKAELNKSTDKIVKSASLNVQAHSSKTTLVEEKKSTEKVKLLESASSQNSNNINAETLVKNNKQNKSLQKRNPSIIGDRLPKNVEIHFMQVCIFNPTATFCIGENMHNRRVIAVTDTECLLIPRYWLIQRNKGNVWNRIQQFLNSHIPSSKKVYQEFLNQKKWLAHRKGLVDNILNGHSPSGNIYSNVPYFIRINEDIEF